MPDSDHSYEPTDSEYAALLNGKILKLSNVIRVGQNGQSAKITYADPRDITCKNWS